MAHQGPKLGECRPKNVKNVKFCHVRISVYPPNVDRFPQSKDYKKLCYGRGTTRRTCQYQNTCNWWTTLTYTQGHHSCCYQMTVRHITTCLWTVVSRSLSRTVFKTVPLLKSTWLHVTLRTPSFLTTKLKLQATCAFEFMCKHIVVIGYRYYKGFWEQKWPFQTHSRSSAIMPFDSP